MFAIQEVVLVQVQQGHQNPHHLIEVTHHLLALKITVLLIHVYHHLGNPVHLLHHGPENSRVSTEKKTLD